MRNRQKQNTRIFKFLSESAIRRDHFDLTSWQSLKLRGLLAKGIFWIQPVPRGKVIWNIDLLTSYMISGMSPETYALIEEFQSTLPTAA
jgi:hypothetical protein